MKFIQFAAAAALFTCATASNSFTTETKMVGINDGDGERIENTTLIHSHGDNPKRYFPDPELVVRSMFTFYGTFILAAFLPNRFPFRYGQEDYHPGHVRTWGLITATFLAVRLKRPNLLRTLMAGHAYYSMTPCLQSPTWLYLWSWQCGYTMRVLSDDHISGWRTIILYLMVMLCRNLDLIFKN